MADMKRALSDEFCRQLHSTGTWPTDDEFKAAARAHHRACSNGTLGELKRGNPVDEKYCRTLIWMMNYPAQTRLRDAIADFVRGRASIEIDTVSIEQILEVTCRPAGEERDWIAASFADIVGALSSRPSIPLGGRPCKDPREVFDAVRWLYVDAGRLRTKDRLINPEAAIAVAEQLGQVPLDEFQRRMLSWWQKDRHVVMVARGDKRPIAMTAMLPLREDVWHDIRSGNRHPFTIVPSDIQTPSPFLFLVATAERTVDLNGEPKGYTYPLLITLLRQTSCLSDLGYPPRADLCLLGYAGTELARTRLTKRQFTPTGTTLPRIGADLYEKYFYSIPSQRTLLDGLFLSLLSLLNKTSK